MSFTVPEYWFVDSEAFCPWQIWVTNIQKSKNAEAQRRAGETDAHLALRISTAFMDLYNTTVNEASGGKTATGWFWGSPGNKGVGTYPWPILRDLDMLSQPAWCVFLPLERYRCRAPVHSQGEHTVREPPSVSQLPIK